ncbi:MAG: ATP-binding protein [Deltaproteobacteria bacterium]|nr:ATP-binding protein [Deltaproteobacteria bacterium]
MNLKKLLIKPFGIRRKLIIILLLFAIVPSYLAGISGEKYSTYILEDATLRHLEFELSSKAHDSEQFLKTIHRDVQYLSKTVAMRDMVDLGEGEYKSVFHRLRNRLEKAFLIIAQTRPYYDQIRYIDENGFELVRVNNQGDEAEAVTREKLQFKGDRYYFKKTMSYWAEECYVSPMDLNIERGVIELPEKPVVRVATPVFNSKRERKGIVVINLFASYLINQIQKTDITKGGTTFLVNKDHFYLSHINSLKLDSRSFKIGSINDLSGDFSENVVAHLLSGSPGTVRTEQEIISYHPIFTGDKTSKDYWVLAMAYPRKNIFASVSSLIKTNMMIGAVTILTVSIVGIWLARRFAKPIVMLHRGVESISEGDFDHKINIKTGDEIEMLAEQFNNMTSTLKESRNKLLNWNESLKDEVAERTKELELEKNKFESVLMCASEGIIVADEEDNILIMNPAAEAILGVKKDGKIGQSIMGCHKNPDKIRALLSGQSPVPSSTVSMTVGSQQLEISAAVVAFEGKRYGSMMVVRDVSERQRLIDETIMMERQLLHADKLVTIGELSAGIAHEIGNPLAAIKTVIQSMEEVAPFRGEQEEYIDRILREIDRLNLFIKTFSTFAHPGVSMKIGSCDIDYVLDEVLFMIEKEAEKNDIAIIDERQSEPAEVLISEDLLKQVFVNLFVNAIHAMPSGGSIVINNEEREGDLLKVSVADSGKGISSEDMSKVFDPFFTTKSDGTGLGLSIVHRILEEHGGDIRVKSILGQGTTFDLLFPVNHIE